jgi:signal transduction histidine kinase
VAGLSRHAPPESVWWFLFSLVAGLPSLVLGLTITRKREFARIGALLMIPGMVLISSAGFDAYVAAALAAPGGLPLSTTVVALSQGMWMLFFIPWGWLLLIFPDGHFRSASGRYVAIALPVVAVAFSVLAAVSPGPYADPYSSMQHPFGEIPGTDIAGIALLPLFLALLVCCVISAVRRFRAGSFRVRRQLRWLALAGWVIPGALAIAWVGYVALGVNVIAVSLLVIYVVVPAAVTIALLRSDDFDVERVLVRGTVLGALAALLAAILGITLPILPLITATSSPLPAATVTVVAVLFVTRLRSPLERLVGAWMYPAVDRTLRAISALEARVYAGEDGPEVLEGILRESLRDPELRLGYLLPGSKTFSDASGNRVEVTESSPRITFAGHTIGALVLRNDRSLPIREITDAVTVLVEMARLRLELTQAMKDVDASRTRLLHASYEERERLERDLHDGAQQRLIAVGMSLRLTQRHLPGGSRVVHDALDEAVAELGQAVLELRQIAHGLRPSSLDDGLAAALAHLSSTAPLPVDLELETGDLTDAVSTTAYFVASESVANAVKHGGASRIWLRVARSDDSLAIRVSDDGNGGASLRPGGGLAGLQDRVHAIGGSLRLTSEHGVGTSVEAVLPCDS